MGKWGTAFDVLRDVVYGQSEYLDLYEQTTLHFIFRRTRMYQKEWEYIPMRHFLNGISGPQGLIVTPRIRISEKTLLQSLKRLERKGIITVERSGTGANKYRINEDSELDTKKIVKEFINQIPIARDLARQVEKNAHRLPPSQREGAIGLSDIPEFQRKRPTRNAVSPPSPVKGEVTALVTEHNIPILKKPIKRIPRRKATECSSGHSNNKLPEDLFGTPQGSEAKRQRFIRPLKLKPLRSAEDAATTQTLLTDRKLS